MTDKVKNTAPESTPEFQTGSGTYGSWWIDRVGSCDLFDAMVLDEKARTGPGDELKTGDLLGKALWISFLVVVISGIGLLAGYSPSISGAFASVEKIQNGGGLGWLLRGVHKYGTDLFIILAVLRLIRIAYRRGYKSGGELGWVCALVALIFGIISGLTGYLLIWNQRIFASGSLTAGEVLAFEDIFPLGGLGLKGWPAQWLAGSEGMTQGMLTTVFAVHIGLSAIGLLFFVFWRHMKRDQTELRKHFSLKIPRGVIWYIIGALVLLSLIIPPPLGISSDGILKPHPFLADWFLLGLYEFADIFPSGVLNFIILFSLALAVFLPWIDRSTEPGPRPSMTALITAVLLSWFVLTVRALGIRIPDFWVLSTISIIWFICFGIGIAREIRFVNKPKNPGDMGASG